MCSKKYWVLVKSRLSYGIAPSIFRAYHNTLGTSTIILLLSKILKFSIFFFSKKTKMMKENIESLIYFICQNQNFKIN